MASSSRARFIESHVPGRLRLRHPALREATTNAALRQTIAALDGVLSAEGNPGAGSILVLYDPAHLEPATIEERLTEWLAAPQSAPARRARRRSPVDELAATLNRPAKIGAATALGATVAALAVSRRLHAMFGTASLGFLAVHMFNQRRGLFK